MRGLIDGAVRLLGRPVDVGVLRSDDRGAALAIVALLLIVMLGLTAMVVDLGAMRTIRRSLVPATDAAALAAAQELAEHPWDVNGACAEAGAYVAVNTPQATLTECYVAYPSSQTSGTVEITAVEDADTSFAAPASGPPTLQSSSTATWGPPLAVSDLRPIGFCYDGSSYLKYLIDYPPSHIKYVRLPFLPDDPDDCGGQPDLGSFSAVDLVSGASLDDLRDWTRDGYPEAMRFGQGGTGACGNSTTCRDRSDALPDLDAELSSLVTTRRYVAFPIFDHVDEDRVELIGVLRARVYDFELDGDPSSWELELKIDPGLIAGECCGTAGLSAGNRVVAICGVDDDESPLCPGPNA